METDALRWFQHVADGMTVTEVAEVFMVSQPGVSRALDRLEREIGTPLLRRSGRVLRMTQAGTVFKRHVDALVHELDDGLAAVDQLVDPETGTVTVAFQLSLGTWLVPTLISDFRSLHPNVSFALEPSRDEDLTPVLSGGRVDLELTSRRPRDPRVRWRRLFAEPFYLAVPADHRLAARVRVHLAEVAEEPFVALRPTWLLRSQVAQACERAGFAPRIAFEADDLPTARGFVAAGLGVAVIPAMGQDPVSGRLDGLSLVQLDDPQATREVGAVWSVERRLLPAAQLFRRHVLRTAAAR